MTLEPTFYVWRFKDAENRAEMIPSGLANIFNLKSFWKMIYFIRKLHFFATQSGTDKPAGRQP